MPMRFYSITSVLGGIQLLLNKLSRRLALVPSNGIFWLKPLPQKEYSDICLQPLKSLPRKSLSTSFPWNGTSARRLKSIVTQMNSAILLEIGD